MLSLVVLAMVVVVLTVFQTLVSAQVLADELGLSFFFVSKKGETKIKYFVYFLPLLQFEM